MHLYAYARRPPPSRIPNDDLPRTVRPLPSDAIAASSMRVIARSSSSRLPGPRHRRDRTHGGHPPPQRCPPRQLLEVARNNRTSTAAGARQWWRYLHGPATPTPKHRMRAGHTALFKNAVETTAHCFAASCREGFVSSFVLPVYLPSPRFTLQRYIHYRAHVRVLR